MPAMGGTASAFVRQWPDFGGHARAVRRIIWQGYKEKNGTAWTCPADLSSEALGEGGSRPSLN